MVALSQKNGQKLRVPKIATKNCSGMNTMGEIDGFCPITRACFSFFRHLDEHALI